MLDADSLKRIAPYVTDPEKPVFCLRNLPEEVVAVLFAYYSRSRDDLRTNLARLLADEELAIDHGGAPEARLGFAEAKAKEFHEKWVVGYGHASVAEHAVAHLALEGISIVASKVVEDARLAAFTEKSTRYVLFDGKSFVPLEGALPDGLAKKYSAAASKLIDSYVLLYEPTVENLKNRIPKGDSQTPRAYEAAMRAQACDVLRYLLPAGTRTNVGMTTNGRALEHLLKKMGGSKLLEIRDLATEIKTQASFVIPTLLKYVEPSPHRVEMNARVAQAFSRTGLQFDAISNDRKAGHNAVTLVGHDDDALVRVVSAIAFEQTHGGYSSVRDRVRSLSEASQQQVFDAYVSNRGKYDAPLRALENTTYTFDVLLDYGAFRDMQRHRMQTQMVQRLGMQYGYELPPLAYELGLDGAMASAIEEAGEVWAHIAQHYPEEAQYVVPLAARTRYLLTCNLREAFHVVELRSARQGHISYRNVAQQMWQRVNEVHPWAAKHMRVDMADYQTARTG